MAQIMLWKLAFFPSMPVLQLLPSPMRLLIADDDRLVCEMLKSYAEAFGHEVVETVSGGGLAVIQSYSRHRPDAVLLDVVMPRLNGFTVCRNILSRYPEAKIILMSGVIDPDDYSIAQSGAVAYLQKPFEMSVLDALLKSVFAEQPTVPKTQAAA